MTDYHLPETAAMFAISLRELLGEPKIFARVIQADDADSTEPNGISYIRVGRLFGDAEECELFCVYAPDNYHAPGWSLFKTVDYPATRSEPGFTDIENVAEESNPTAIMGKMAELLFTDKLNVATMDLLMQRHLAFDTRIHNTEIE